MEIHQLEFQDLPITKIQIHGATLASIIQRLSSSDGDVDGLLFGQVSKPPPSTHLDDDITCSTSTSTSSQQTLIATVTNYYCSGNISTFYDSLGRLSLDSLKKPLTKSNFGPGVQLLGWFVGRRRTKLRPSMREYAVSSSFTNTETLKRLGSFVSRSGLAGSSFGPIGYNAGSSTGLSGSVIGSDGLAIVPSLFMILTTPMKDQLIHTHEHRAYQYRSVTSCFEPLSMDVINIGPGFRVDYGAFVPNAAFPMLEYRGSGDMDVVIDGGKECLSTLRKLSKEQKGMDVVTDGYDVGKLKMLMGSEAVRYTMALEELYVKMLDKLERVAEKVEKSSAMVLEQEQRTVKLKNKIAGLE